MRAAAALKNLAAVSAHRSGLVRLLAARRLRNRAFVLMYHRILSAGEDPLAFQPGMIVLQGTFEAHVALLKRHFHVIPLPELLERIRRGQDVTRCCCITFDDGWHDTFRNAYPVLKRHAAPATVFLATGHVGTDRPFWFEEVRAAVARAPGRAREVLGRHPVGDRAALPSAGDRRALIDAATEAMKSLAPDRRDALCAALRAETGGDALPGSMMTWEEVQALHDSGLVEIGAHTVHHVLLDQLSPARAEEEVRASVEAVRSRFNRDRVLFSYPNGNYNPAVLALCGRSPISGAVTVRKGFVHHGTPVLEVPRISVHEDIASRPARLWARIAMPGF